MKTEYIKVLSGEDTVVNVEQDTQFVLDLTGSDKTADLSFSVVFEKPGVKAEIIGIYKLLEDQKIKLETASIHKVPNTECFTRIKGVLMDNSQSDYRGKIIIEKRAQQTNSFLEDNVVVMGQNTKNSSQPILEIDADDVKASHGATTGRVSPEQVLYLKSRGLSEEEAQDIIIEGFFASLLGRIEDERIRDKVKEKLNV